AEYYYPLQQSARFLWYHDHAWGITRINAYAGIATALLIRDNFEIGLKNLGLPEFVEAGGRELPIIVQDKIFGAPAILTVEPAWTAQRWTRRGPAGRIPGASGTHTSTTPTARASGGPPPPVRRPPSPWCQSSSATRCWPTAPSTPRSPSRRAGTGCASSTPATLAS